MFVMSVVFDMFAMHTPCFLFPMHYRNISAWQYPVCGGIGIRPLSGLRPAFRKIKKTIR